MRKNLLLLLFVIFVATGVVAQANQPTEITLLNNFEADLEGWKLATDWAGGKAVSLSTEQASDGEQSLALEASYTGDGTWQEAGVSVDPQDGADWTGSTQLVMDVFVPEEAENLIAQIFMKTGEGWTWANSADNPLTPGAWTAVTADLSTMGDLSAVRQFGVKIGTSATAFDGVILIDNVRLVAPAVTSDTGRDTSVAHPVEPEVQAINSVTPPEASVGVYEKLELVADIDAIFSNPYDPADIRVDGRFTSPSGKAVVVPGFYYREFTNTNGNVTPTDNWSWRVRFTPTEAGEWQYQVLATTLKGIKRSEVGTFTATESDHRGFVRVDPRNPRYFVFDDGTPYYPIGENMGWSTGNPLTDYPVWLDKLQAAGGNFIRVWMASWGFGIEWVDTGLGNYDRRQNRAYQLDQLMNMAAERDMYIMLSLLNHGAFNTTTNPEWDQNPYNAANGGPCAEPTCFATDPQAIKFWNQRLRYIAARWGYSPNIMAWEWWNEVNWTGLVNPDILVPWMERSAAYLASLDPYDHLITHSGSPVDNEQVWGLDSIDFTQNHLYNMTNLPLTFNQNIPEWLEAYPDKPFLMGEFGSSSGGESSDKQGVTLHLGIWSAPMNGAAGSAMTWWWDNYIDPLNLYDHFSGLAAFLDSEDLAAQQWQPASASIAEPAKANVYGLQSDDSALLWVVNTDYSEQYLQTGATKALRDAMRQQNNSPAAYSFEDDVNGWALSGDWAAGKDVTQSSDLATDGALSLSLSAAYTGGGTWQEAGAFVQPEGGADWSAYSTVTVDIYAPEDAEGFTAQVFAKTGDDWAWENSQDTALSPGEWTTVTVPLSTLGDVSALREFGVKIGSSTGVLDGTFLIDNIRLKGVNPDKLVIPFPDVEAASLTINGLPDGSYTVEVWDTMAGTVMNTSSVDSTGGSLTIELPTFSTDLAVKVKPE